MSSKTIKITLGSETRKRVLSERTYAEMQALVAECFSSQLKDYNYALSYLDSDKDKITITCDAELNVALSEDQDPLRLLLETKTPTPPPFAAPGGPLEIHPAVTCDGCGMYPLAGTRFKCSVRTDFDLCQECESKDESGFPMLKINKNKDAPAAIFCVQHSDQPEAGAGGAQPEATEEEAQTAEDLLNRILQGDGEVTLADLVGVGVGGCRPLRKALRQMLFRKGGRGPPPHFQPRRCGPGGGAPGPWAHATGPGWRPPWARGPHGPHGAPPPPPHGWHGGPPHGGPHGWRGGAGGSWRRAAEATAASGMSEEEAVAHAVEASMKGAAAKPPALCARFVKHLTVADKTPITSGSEFVKTWGLRNDGESPLPEGCALWNVGGDKMNGAEGSVTIDAVAPGAEFTLSLPLKAPEEPGRYVGYWRLAAPDKDAVEGRGAFFGHRLGVDVLVESAPDDFEVVETGLRARLAELGFTTDAVEKAIAEVGEEGSIENATNFLISGV